jgi:hypothetical protein
MGKFFNERLKNMHYIPSKGMEQARQDFRKEQVVGYINTIPVPPVPQVITTPLTKVVEMTPAQLRMAKARAAKKAKNVAS